MRATVIGLVALVVALAAGADAASEDARERIGSELVAIAIAPKSWVIVHERPWPANALLCEMGDGSLVLCDTPYTAAATRELLAWIRGRFGERELTVINGHFHPDCLGGNCVLIEADAAVYGSDLTVRLLAERGERARAQTLAAMTRSQIESTGLAKDEWCPPARTFPLADGLRLSFGGEEVWAIFPGPAHAPDNVVTFFPERDVVFAGCMALTGTRPGYTEDADLDRWGEAVERVKALGATVVVPGHGERFDAAVLDHTLEVLARKGE